MAQLLDDDALQAALTGLDEWQGDGKAIRRTVSIAGAQQAQLLAEMSQVAREMNHDPDLDVAPETVTITMSTHSAGGVTDLDVEYARRTDELVTKLAT